MAIYTVRAINAEGRIRTRREFALDEADLERRLQVDGLSIARVVRVRENSSSSKLSIVMSRSDLHDFTERLQILHAAGIPILGCLREIEVSSRSKNLARAAKVLASDIESGIALSDSMLKMPRAFPTTYRTAIHAAERSGALDDVLKVLAQQIEWERSTIAGVVQALIYPAILSCAVLGLLAFLFCFLLPRIEEFFRQSSAELPFATQVVLWISAKTREYGLLVASSVAGIALACYVARKSSTGRAVLDRLALRLPILGTMLRKLSCARFVATLYTVYHAGAPMLEALGACRQSTGNGGMEKDIELAVDQIANGHSLTDALGAIRDIEPVAITMIRVGEASGSLSDSLLHASTILEKELTRYTKRALALLEPFILIVSGVVVGFVIFASLMPVFRLIGGISK